MWRQDCVGYEAFPRTTLLVQGRGKKDTWEEKRRIGDCGMVFVCVCHGGVTNIRVFVKMNVCNRGEGGDWRLSKGVR